MGAIKLTFFGGPYFGAFLKQILLNCIVDDVYDHTIIRQPTLSLHDFCLEDLTVQVAPVFGQGTPDIASVGTTFNVFGYDPKVEPITFPTATCYVKVAIFKE